MGLQKEFGHKNFTIFNIIYIQVFLNNFNSSITNNGIKYKNNKNIYCLYFGVKLL